MIVIFPGRTLLQVGLCHLMDLDIAKMSVTLFHYSLFEFYLSF